MKGKHSAEPSRIFSLCMIIFSLLCLVWALLELHPSSGVSGQSANSRSANTVAEVEAVVQRITTALEGAQPEVVRIHYSIPEEDTVAPPPLETCYGTIPWDQPELVLEVLDQAREYGLLGEDETVAFDVNAEFSDDRDIEYYLDETILTLCWKEIVDNRVCSFVEVKIADASQFRRKFADEIGRAHV